MAIQELDIPFDSREEVASAVWQQQLHIARALVQQLTSQDPERKEAIHKAALKFMKDVYPTRQTAIDGREATELLLAFFTKFLPQEDSLPERIEPMFRDGRVVGFKRSLKRGLDRPTRGHDVYPRDIIFAFEIYGLDGNGSKSQTEVAAMHGTAQSFISQRVAMIRIAFLHNTT